MNTATEVIDPEVVEPEIVRNEIELRKPSIPVSVDELAALDEDHGVAIVQQRHKIVDALRRASISLTNPQDWLLFRADDRITAYLQDSGAQRIMPLWGIEITPKDDFHETRIGDDPDGDYAITCYGDAYCNVTNITLRDIEGTRYSDEDFCKSLPPIRKKIRVQQASVANRNGNAVRKLSGLSNVAIELIEDVWKGTGKTIALCPKGKGYGSGAERQGANVQQAADVPAGLQPKCPECGEVMKFVPAGKSARGPYDAFWACKNRDHKKSFKHDEVVKEAQKHLAYQQQKGGTDQNREPGMEG